MEISIHRLVRSWPQLKEDCLLEVNDKKPKLTNEMKEIKMYALSIHVSKRKGKSNE